MHKRKTNFDLYLITDRKLFGDNNSFFAAVEEALKAGVRAVQLREKDLPTRELLGMAYRMRELTSKYNALFFVNDRLDIALAVGADGIHLGHTSMPVHAVRTAVHASRITHHASRFLIGVSTHSFQEAVTAEKEDADFITFGPVFATPSKMKYGKPLGPALLKEVTGMVSLPVLAVGGIKPDNVNEVMEAGATGVAVISGILTASDVEAAAKKYAHITNKY